MSISNTTYQTQATGDGVTQTFSFPFKIFNASQLVVNQITPAGDINSTPYVLGTDYLVWINPVAEGGIVTWMVAPPQDYIVQLTRIVPYTQSVTIATEGALPALQISNQLDLMTMMIIQSSIPINTWQSIFTNVVYIGSPAANGSWRFLLSGTQLLLQTLVAGVWTTKETYS